MGKSPVLEYHSILRVEDILQPFNVQLANLMEQISYNSIGKRLRAARFFISDASNQISAVEAAISNLGCPVSIIQQPPLDGSKIAALCYWTKGELNPTYEHKVVCGLLSEASAEGSLSQTEEIFSKYGSILEASGQSIAENCIRTWLFVRDVDVNYAGVVRGRRNCFDKIGLTSDTHYIASTGIQGTTADFRNLVMMDAYSVGGLKPEQKRYLYGKSHLNPTYEYGVTFERGVIVDYGDRRHVFVSGTASIDNKGQVLHEGDIVSQCERMMENVGVLLSEADCKLTDIESAILYLRDTADYQVVNALFKSRWPYLDPVVVLAPVCRPSWLVEMECIASVKSNNPAFPVF